MNFPVGSYGDVYWGAQNSSSGSNFNAQNYSFQNNSNNSQANAPVTAYNWNTPYAIYDSSYYDRYKGASTGYTASAPSAPAGGTVTAGGTSTAGNLKTSAPATPAAPQDAASIERVKILTTLEDAKEAVAAGDMSHEEFMDLYYAAIGANKPASTKTQTGNAASGAGSSNASGTTVSNAADLATIEDLKKQIQELSAAPAGSATEQRLAQLEVEKKKLTEANVALTKDKTAAEKAANLTAYGLATNEGKAVALDKPTPAPDDGDKTAYQAVVENAAPIFNRESKENTAAGEQFYNLKRKKQSAIAKALDKNSTPEEKEKFKGYSIPAIAVVRDKNGDMLDLNGNVTKNPKEAAILTVRDEKGLPIKDSAGANIPIYERLIEGKTRYAVKSDAEVWYVSPHAAAQSVLEDYPGIGDGLTGFVTAGWTNQTEKRVMTSSANEIAGVIATTGIFNAGDIRSYNSYYTDKKTQETSFHGYVPAQIFPIHKKGPDGKFIGLDKKKPFAYASTAFSYRIDKKDTNYESFGAFDYTKSSINDKTNNNLFILDNVVHFKRFGKNDKKGFHLSLILDGDLSTRKLERSTNGAKPSVSEDVSLTHFVAPALNYTNSDLDNGATISGYIGIGNYGRKVVNNSESLSEAKFQYTPPPTTAVPNPAPVDVAYNRTEATKFTNGFNDSAGINGAELYVQYKGSDKHSSAMNFFSLFGRYHKEKSNGFDYNFERTAEARNPSIPLPTNINELSPTGAVAQNNPASISESANVEGENSAFLLRGIGVTKRVGGVVWYADTKTTTPKRFNVAASGQPAQFATDFNKSRTQLFGWFLDTGSGGENAFSNGRLNYEFNGSYNKTTTESKDLSRTSVSKTLTIAPRVNYAFTKWKSNGVGFATVGLDYVKSNSENTSTKLTTLANGDTFYNSKETNNSSYAWTVGVSYYNKSVSYTAKNKGQVYANVTATLPITNAYSNQIKLKSDGTPDDVYNPPKQKLPLGLRFTVGMRF